MVPVASIPASVASAIGPSKPIVATSVSGVTIGIPGDSTFDESVVVVNSDVEVHPVTVRVVWIRLTMNGLSERPHGLEVPLRQGARIRP